MRMGMAASQARYLELTARKSNVEYEGQQVNQQRTQLANESAGLFQKLTALQVPTAPSASDYTKATYTFNDGANVNTISDIKTLTGDAENNATVTYFNTQSIYTGIAKSRTNMSVSNNGTNYYLGTTKLAQCATDDKDVSTEEKAILQICKDASKASKIANFRGDVGYDSTKSDDENLSSIATNIGNVYTYTASDNTKYYLSKTDLNQAIAAGGTNQTISTYYAADLSTNVYTTSKAYLQTSDSDTSRYSSISLADSSTSFDLTCTTTTDNNAYNDAMNEYSYKKEQYEQEMTAINAKTSIIQQQDRTLELRLRQLDTEQLALSTELDAVKKVIDKNVENTFKTFNN